MGKTNKKSRIYTGLLLHLSHRVGETENVPTVKILRFCSQNFYYFPNPNTIERLMEGTQKININAKILLFCFRH
jgi:hypothetical protein